ncbi:MAG: hypothetical protein H6607_02335 [Flavobacteriales bacterium]|nr:hypothetical protein [Flavobacteriales bacterium]
MKRILLLLALAIFGLSSCVIIVEHGECSEIYFRSEPTIDIYNESSSPFSVRCYNNNFEGDTIFKPHYLPLDMNADTMNYEFFRDSGSIGKMLISYKISPIYCEEDDEHLLQLNDVRFAPDSGLHALFNGQKPIVRDSGYSLNPFDAFLYFSF